jgi:threonine/homoserine efflux transporter RhtA
MQFLGLILATIGALMILLYRPRTKQALSETRAIALLGCALILLVAGLYLSIRPGA